MKHTMKYVVRHLMNRRNLVFMAIFFMIASACLSFYYVEHNNRKIAMAAAQAQHLDGIIRDTWFDTGQIGQRTDTAVIVSLLDGHTKDPELLKIRRHYLSNFPGIVKNEQSSIKILEASDKEQEKNLDIINKTYLEKSEIEQNIMQMEQHNRFYTTLVFFLQIAGLALVVYTRELPL